MVGAEKGKRIYKKLNNELEGNRMGKRGMDESEMWGSIVIERQ